MTTTTSADLAELVAAGAPLPTTVTSLHREPGSPAYVHQNPDCAQDTAPVLEFTTLGDTCGLFESLQVCTRCHPGAAQYDTVLGVLSALSVAAGLLRPTREMLERASRLLDEPPSPAALVGASEALGWSSMRPPTMPVQDRRLPEELIDWLTAHRQDCYTTYEELRARYLRHDVLAGYIRQLSRPSNAPSTEPHLAAVNLHGRGIGTLGRETLLAYQPQAGEGLTELALYELPADLVALLGRDEDAFIDLGPRLPGDSQQVLETAVALHRGTSTEDPLGDVATALLTARQMMAEN